MARWGKFTPTKFSPIMVIKEIFSEVCCYAFKNTHCCKVLCKGLKAFPEKRFRLYRGFGFHRSNYILSKFENDWNKNVNSKIILIGENLFPQTYCNKISFLTDWFLRIKWLYAKSVKITIKKNSYPKRKSVAKIFFCNDISRTISN